MTTANKVFTYNAVLLILHSVFSPLHWNCVAPMEKNGTGSDISLRWETESRVRGVRQVMKVRTDFGDAQVGLAAEPLC